MYLSIKNALSGFVKLFLIGGIVILLPAQNEGKQVLKTTYKSSLLYSAYGREDCLVSDKVRFWNTKVVQASPSDYTEWTESRIVNESFRVKREDIYTGQPLYRFDKFFAIQSMPSSPLIIEISESLKTRESRVMAGSFFLNSKSWS
ncbi:MAG: hypothetical protein ACI9K1_001891 [Arcticibacterium sp.]|jgi:hypothetical protein